jgi:hypothetical protein
MLAPLRAGVFTLAAMLCVCGCMNNEEWDRWASKERGEQPEAEPRSDSSSKAISGTIGPLVTIDGLQLLQVRGYGLVMDLVDTGGKDGPDVVKKYLLKEIRRHTEIGMPGLNPDQIFNNLDASMVEVTGLIPAAARKGEKFDVVVRALGSQAKSLVGGRLVLCDLKLYAETPTGVIEGKLRAMASGPVFVSPFDREGFATSKVDLRTGFVFGGGVVTEPRKIILALNDPRYSTAQQIVTRLNGQYSTVDPIAKASGPGSIELSIPEEYRDRKRLYLERVVHTTLNANPALLEKRAKDLAREISEDDPDFNAIGLAWEAIGKNDVLPVIRELYENPDLNIAYYAGRTGMRLGDNKGMEVVAKAANDPGSKLREEAIEDLGYAVNMHGAGEHLRKLLDDENYLIRISAYRGLRRRIHPAIKSHVLDKDNMILDVVESKGPFMVYVQRLNEPRIALFGSQMRVEPPAIFPDPTRDDKRRLLTVITAQKDDKSLTVIYKNKRTKRQSPSLEAPLDVSKLIQFLGDTFGRDNDDKVTGLAVPYSEVVEILQAFCKARTIPAKFVVEEQAPGDSSSPDDRERDESEY